MALEPGIVLTELSDHVTDDNVNAWLADTRQRIELLQPEDVARTVAFAAGLPRHVNLQQLTVMPTQQQS